MLRVSLVALLALILSGVASAGAAAPAQVDTLWRQSAPGGLAGWTVTGVDPNPAGFRLSPRMTGTVRCARADVDGRPVHFDPVAGLCSGTDRGPRNVRAYYGGVTFGYGTMRSPIVTPSSAVDHLIVSWQAITPTDTWIEVHVRVREAGRWTHLYALPIWASGTKTLERHSVNDQHDRWGRVDTDTFVAAHPATAYQVEFTLFTAVLGLTPTVRAVTVAASRDTPYYPSAGRSRVAWGVDLRVPQRSQMLPQYRASGYGGGGEAWCSPTSTDMVMAYWSQIDHRPGWNLPVPAVAAGTYDATYDGTGNWPFNTAFAAEYGLTAYVARLPSLDALQSWIAAGVPVVISIAFRRGELPGEPVGVSGGHLIVVRGFTRTGDVIANDPAAATDAGVRIVFSRAALERVWQEGSHGTAYIIYPPGRHVPGA